LVSCLDWPRCLYYWRNCQSHYFLIVLSCMSRIYVLLLLNTCYFEILPFLDESLNFNNPLHLRTMDVCSYCLQLDNRYKGERSAKREAETSALTILSYIKKSLSAIAIVFNIKLHKQYSWHRIGSIHLHQNMAWKW
jgi:hypothetical protein